MSIEQEIRDYEALNADTAMQLNKAQQRIAELESQLAHKEELRQEALGCLKNATSRADKLQAQLDECVDYLKDGETIAECIQRNRDDASSTLTLLAKEKRKSEELQAQLEAQNHGRIAWQDRCLKAEAQLAEYKDAECRALKREAAALKQLEAVRALTVFDTDGDSSLQFVSKKALQAILK